MRLFTVSFLFLSLVAVSGAARADGDKPNGHRAGSYLLAPSVTIMQVFDDNIYASRSNTKSDFISILSPKIEAVSNNPSRGVHARFESRHGFYLHHSDENFNDAQAELSPYVVITRALSLRGGLSWERGHEDRAAESGLNTSLAREPVQWQRGTARLEAVYKRGRVGFTPFGEFARLRFDNVARVGGGQSFIHDDRDRDETTLGTELYCDITDRSALYTRIERFDRNYKRNDFDTGPGTYTGNDRDTDGVRAILGLRMPATALVALDVHAGYHHQRFDDPAFDTLRTFVGSADLSWAVTPLTTIMLGAARTAHDTAQDGAAAYIAHTGHLKISHELRRNLTVDAGIFAARHAYDGFDRDDDLIGGGAGLAWRMNRRLRWRADYAYEDRDSNIAASRYDKQRVSISLNVDF